jgi:hypothetical protein
MADLDVLGVRLIVSDPLIAGGQVVQTFKAKPQSIEQILALLCKKPFKFKDLCKEHGLEVQSVISDGLLHMVGHDGPRRRAIVTNKNLVQFLLDIKHTTLPSIEVQLVQKEKRSGTAGPPSAVPSPTAAGGGKASVPPTPGASEHRHPQRARVDMTHEIEWKSLRIRTLNCSVRLTVLKSS